MSLKAADLSPENKKYIPNSCFRYAYVNGRILLKQVLKNQVLWAWTGFTSFKVRNTIIIDRFLKKIEKFLKHFN
jgi:hypothetical protein